MAAPRKIFRIEKTGFARPAVAKSVTPAAPALALSVAAPAIQREQIERIASELAAVSSSAAQATQKILAVAEEIDQIAANLAASLKGKIDRDLAADISDHVIRIFEACNFQAVSGQRVAKVMAMLKTVEASFGAAPAGATPQRDAVRSATHGLHGPRLDNDSGHVTQSEIDAMFGG